VPVPSGITPGAQILQVNGFAQDGSVRSLSIGILVTPAGTQVTLSRKTTSVFFAPLGQSRMMTHSPWHAPHLYRAG